MKKNQTKILLFLVYYFSVLCLAPTLAQQESSDLKDTPESESLEQLIGILFKQNPALHAAREKARAAKERVSVDRAFPDPMVGFMIMPDPTPDMEMLSGAKNTEISQMIPLGGKNALAGRIAKTKFSMEEAGVTAELLSQVESLKTAFEELSYLDDAVKIIRENRAVLDQITGVAISKDSPPAVLSEIQRIQTSLAQIGYDEALLTELRIAEEARINSLLNRQSGTSCIPASDLQLVPPPASLSEIIAIGKSEQPEIKMAELGVRMAGQETSMARKERIPDLTLGWKQQRDRNWRRDDRGDSILLDLNLPVWSGKNSARIKEAVHKKAEAKSRLDAEKNKLSVDITSQFVRIQNLWRTIRMYEETLLPQAAKSLEASQAVTKMAEFGAIESIEAQAVWLNFKLSHRRAVADYRQALARLDTLTGRVPVQGSLKTSPSGRKRPTSTSLWNEMK